MKPSIRHIALVVPDLQAAEHYYRTLFDMQIIGREAEQADGQWYTLPYDKGWEEAQAAGIALDMVALRKGQFVLALFKGDASPGQVAFIGLTMDADEIAGVHARLPKELQGSEANPAGLEFVDPFQITWQISLPGSEFSTSGDFSGRWLEL
jgi:catechol 2,3-dioxygenase-like lactoylglutathione lyase family enzyme